MGRALQSGHGIAGRLRPRRGGSRRHHHCRRQHRRLHPHNDHGDRAGDLKGRPAARDRPWHGADRHRGRDQRAGLGRATRRRTLRGMSMRNPALDLPLMLVDVRILAGDVAVLDGISLKLEAGAPTVLIGPNGAGKTTLLRAAMGLLPVTSGLITWGGREYSPPARRAIMFQRPAMLRRCAAGNVRYALAAANVPRDQRDRRIAELLADVGLSGLERRPARRLSGGEQQRLALARALARDPALLFLDEPAASLDPAATKAIEDIIRTVTARGVKVVMSTHDLGQARRLAGDIVLLHRGRLIESGSANDFFANPRTKE